MCCYSTHKNLLISIAVFSFLYSLAAAEEEGLLLRASFDTQADADFAKGESRIFTAKTLARKEVTPGIDGEAVKWEQTGGRTGGALRFLKKTNKLTFFQGGANVPYKAERFEGTVALWMKLSPDDDLPNGYVDPFQITDKKWNDASLFLDFTDKNPRVFRLGVFANHRFWNSDNVKFDDIPEQHRPMIAVKAAPFRRDRWTHVAFTWSNFNEPRSGKAILYLDGTSQGTLDRKQFFTWNVSDVAIMLGINYVGWIDDFRIYDRPLSADAIRLLAR